MITLHLLEHSRAFRVVWLMEELGLSCEIVRYQREADFRAPAALKAVHPLGKSPVIVDGDLTISESATILRYVYQTYGDSHLTPPPGTPDYWRQEEWLDYAESSLAGPLFGLLVARLTGGEPDARARSAAETHLDYFAAHMADRRFVMGEALTLADIQLGYLMVGVEMGGMMDSYPALAGYWARLQQVPSFQAALAKAGSMALPLR